MIKIDVQSTRAEIRSQKPLTVGLRGAKARFSFSKDWENLIKTAVFRQGGKTVTVADIGQEVTIPCEVLTAPGVPVQIGVYGIDSTETIAIPTLWAVTKPVRPGTDPEGDPSTDPTPGLWEQMQGKLGSLEQLDTDDKSSLVAAVNEANRAVCLVTVTDNGDGSYNADKTVLQLMAAQSDGKMLICRLGSLWMHLTDAHNGPTFEFTTVKKNTKCCVTISGDGSVKYSTETLATAQSKLPNPKKLTFVGAATAEYDGSEELEVEIPTKVSQLTNDSGFLTKAPVTSVNGQTGTVNLSVPLRVTVEELENGVTQSDPPYEELAELRNEGHLLYCQHGSLELPLVAVTPFMYIFSCVQGGKVHSVMIGSSSVTVTATPLASGGGTDGITPHIGTNGNWFIGEEDTGVSAGVTDEQISGAVEEYMEENPLVKTINGTAPDENGNVVLDIPSGDGGGDLKTTELIYELVISDEDVFFIEVPIDIRKYEHFRLWIETNVNSSTFRLGVIDTSGVNHYISGSLNVQIHNSAVADFSILANDLVYFKGYRTGFRNQYGAMDGQLVSQPIVINIEASSIRLYREDNFKIGEIVRLYAVPWG